MNISYIFLCSHKQLIYALIKSYVKNDLQNKHYTYTYIEIVWMLNNLKITYPKSLKEARKFRTLY